MTSTEKGILQKKNAMGMWTKKYASCTGRSFEIADNEGGAPFFKCTVSLIARGGEGNDPFSLTIHGEQQGEQINLKGLDNKSSSRWYDVIYKALELAGKVKPRMALLPSRDPRFDLPFVQIPGEYAFSFLNLEGAVLYWFGAITKYGLPGKFSSKPSTEQRMVFLGDKCVYVTKPNSEVTRCMKLNLLDALYTNIGAGGTDKDAFVVLKMKLPEYDLHFSGPEVPSFIEAISAIYKYVKKGMAELPVHSVKEASDPSVALQLSRPENFEMALVRPVTKVQLKTALDNFAAKHGITFAPGEGVVEGTKEVVAKDGAEGTTDGSAPATVATASTAVPTTDPLGCFLIKIGLEQYYFPLYKQNIDIDVLECMDDSDMKNFGIKDPKLVELIRTKMGDEEFMAQVHEDVEAARKDAKWVPKKAPEAAPAPAPAPAAAPAAAPAPAPAPKAGGRPPIILDSDSDDDDFLPPVKKGGGATAANPGSPGGGKKIQMAICLDSDDDDDFLPPPKPKTSAPPKKAPINLDDDDI